MKAHKLVKHLSDYIAGLNNDHMSTYSYHISVISKFLEYSNELC